MYYHLIFVKFIIHIFMFILSVICMFTIHVFLKYLDLYFHTYSTYFLITPKTSIMKWCITMFIGNIHKCIQV